MPTTAPTFLEYLTEHNVPADEEHVWDCPTCGAEVVSCSTQPMPCLDCTCPVVEP